MVRSVETQLLVCVTSTELVSLQQPISHYISVKQWNSPFNPFNKVRQVWFTHAVCMMLVDGGITSHYLLVILVSYFNSQFSMITQIRSEDCIPYFFSWTGVSSKLKSLFVKYTFSLFSVCSLNAHSIQRRVATGIKAMRGAVNLRDEEQGALQTHIFPQRLDSWPQIPSKKHVENRQQKTTLEKDLTEVVVHSCEHLCVHVCLWERYSKYIDQWNNFLSFFSLQIQNKIGELDLEHVYDHIPYQLEQKTTVDTSCMVFMHSHLYIFFLSLVCACLYISLFLSPLVFAFFSFDFQCMCVLGGTASVPIEAKDRCLFQNHVTRLKVVKLNALIDLGRLEMLLTLNSRSNKSLCFANNSGIQFCTRPAEGGTVGGSTTSKASDSVSASVHTPLAGKTCKRCWGSEEVSYAHTPIQPTTQNTHPSSSSCYSSASTLLSIINICEGNV